MPELPEVETVRLGVVRHVVGRVIAGVEVLHPRAVRRHVPGAADLVARLRGSRVLDACRRGKYLWLPLAPSAEPETAPTEALLVHLGMSGQFLARPAEAPTEAHLRCRFTFTDGDPELRFVDQRTFGGLTLDALDDDVPALVRHIARDPLDPLFDDAQFSSALRNRRGGIKRALLDQSLISGVGNIYADEALWRSRLHYDRPAERMTPAQVRSLLADVREVLTEALASGGTSFDALYVNVNGESGYFDRSLNAYGRAGQPCRRCGTPIRREAFMNRSSFFCPHCQRRPRIPRS